MRVVVIPFKARDQAAALVGVNPRYVSDAKKVRDADARLFEEVKAGKVRVDLAARRVEREELRRDRAAQVGKLPQEILVGDFRRVLKDLPDESVDLLFTDPPYDTKSQPLYGDLAALAARVLVPGGSLVAYCPSYAVADILPRMTTQDGLTFWSVLTVRHTGKMSCWCLPKAGARL
jgi:hypothetical protein